MDWKPKYKIGIRTIDEQHKKFFSIANDIIAAREKKVFSRKDLSDLVRRLQNYAEDHFKREENFFDEIKYEGALHIEAHNWYRNKLAQYVESIADSKTDLRKLAKEIGSFSVYWLGEHILTMDKEYTIYYHDH